MSKKYSQSDWQSAEQHKKYYSNQKMQPLMKPERTIFTASISPKLPSEQKRENLYMQRHNNDKAKFSSTQIYISKVKNLAPQTMNGNSSMPRHQ